MMTMILKAIIKKIMNSITSALKQHPVLAPKCRKAPKI